MPAETNPDHRTYAANGVRFQFPRSCSIEEERDDGRVSITVPLSETSFWCLSLVFDNASEEELIESALEALRDVYEEIDVYPASETLCYRESLARDVDFVCLDFLNSAFLRAFRTGQFSALVYYQGPHRELETTREQMERISQSLHCEGDELLFSD